MVKPCKFKVGDSVRFKEEHEDYRSECQLPVEWTVQEVEYYAEEECYVVSSHDGYCTAYDYRLELVEEPKEIPVKKRVLMQMDQVHKTASYLKEHNRIFKDSEEEEIVRKIMQLTQRAINGGSNWTGTAGFYVSIEESDNCYIVDVLCDLSVGGDHISTYVDLEAYTETTND